jgi:hypothetical protein
MKFQIGHLSLNILEGGAGEPTLLFLGYWGGSSRTWNRITGRLSSRFHCVAYDREAGAIRCCYRPFLTQVS